MSFPSLSNRFFWSIKVVKTLSDSFEKLVSDNCDLKEECAGAEHNFQQNDNETTSHRNALAKADPVS